MGAAEVRRWVFVAAVVALLCLSRGDAAANVSIATNPRGDQVILHQVLGQFSRPLFGGVRDADGPFGAFVALPPAQGIGPRGAAVDDAGGAVAAWGTTNGAYEGAGAVMAAVRPPGGKLGPPVELEARRPRLFAVAGNSRGDAIVVWNSSAAIQYAFRPAGGGFEPVAAVPGVVGGVVGAALDSDGTATIAWSRYDASRGFYAISTSTRAPSGEFAPPREVPAVTPPLGVVFAAAPNGRALLAWPQGSSTMVSERPPGGDFGVPFAAGPSESIAALAVAPSGAAAIELGSGHVGLTTRRPGESFSPVEQLGTAAQGYPSGSVAVDDAGDAAAAWGGPDRSVRAAYRGALESTWRRFVLTPSQPLFGMPLVQPAAVAVADSGRATAAWEETDGARVRTFVRDLDSAGAPARQQVNVVPSYVRLRPRANCESGVRVVRRTRTSTVFVDRGEAYGCLFAIGGWVWLKDDENYWVQSPRRVALAGALMAYAEDLVGHGVQSSTLVVRDLRDPEGGVRRDVPAASTEAGEVAAVRLRGNGAVAWISCPASEVPLGLSRACQQRGGDRKQVWVLSTRTRRPRLADSGRQIDPRSFRLRGERLTWRHGKRLRHAVLR
jgi:hypothetical protein